MEQKKRGNHFGAEVDYRSFSRFRRNGTFAEGNGVFWLGKPDLLFLCTPTSRPIHSP
jgi:hypothetical protein